jgi:hypothetical protein
MLTDCCVDECFEPELLIQPLLYAKCVWMVEDSVLLMQGSIYGFEISVLVFYFSVIKCT